MRRTTGAEGLLQRQLWRLAGQAMAAAPVGSAPRLYVDSLNSTFDQQEVRLSALNNRVPSPVLGIEVVGADRRPWAARDAHLHSRSRPRADARRRRARDTAPARHLRPRPANPRTHHGAIDSAASLTRLDGASTCRARALVAPAKAALGRSQRTRKADGESPRVISPAKGVAVMAKTDVISWGLFGVVWGAIVGAAANGGILSSIKTGVVTGVLWAIFGLVAGALYGLWAGRAVSARRLKESGRCCRPTAPRSSPGPTAQSPSRPATSSRRPARSV